MRDVQAEQRALQCPSCGGQCVYAPEDQALKCESCGPTREIAAPRNTDAAKEVAYDPATATHEVPQIAHNRVHHCETCGGSIVFTGPILSERCAYCDGPVVLGTEDAAYETTAVIPFAVSEVDAQDQAIAWAGRRIAAPGALMGHIIKARVAGLYAPFWTFDSTEAVNYWARVTKGSGKRRRSKRIKGRMTIGFDDLLVPASHHVTPLIRDGILHEFDPTRLRPYLPAYLSGFAAERHHQTVDEGLLSNEPDKDLLIRNRIRRNINASGVSNIGYRTDTTGIRYRRILLPVWILHYEHEGTAYKIVVCGIHGRTFGERPFSRWKVMGLSALLSAATIGFGLLWGALGAL